MTISLKHAFQSAKSDGADPTTVQPSNWNAEHVITCNTNSLLGRASPGSGNIEEVPCTSVGRTVLAAATADDIAALLDVANKIQAAFPPGMIIAFGGGSAPTGWLLCDGSAVSRTTYSRLYTVIGSSWGSGDGSSTFNVPDLRGVFLRGLDGGKGYDGGRALGSYQADGYPSHTHTLTDNGHSHNYTAGGVATGYVGNGGSAIPVSLSAPAGGSVSTSATTGITIAAGGGSAPEVRPKNAAVLYCIRT